MRRMQGNSCGTYRWCTDTGFDDSPAPWPRGGDVGQRQVDSSVRLCHPSINTSPQPPNGSVNSREARLGPIPTPTMIPDGAPKFSLSRPLRRSAALVDGFTGAPEPTPRSYKNCSARSIPPQSRQVSWASGGVTRPAQEQGKNLLQEDLQGFRGSHMSVVHETSASA